MFKPFELLQAKKEIVGIDFQTLANKNEIVECVGFDAPSFEGGLYEIDILRFGVQDGVTVRLSESDLQYFQKLELTNLSDNSKENY